VDQTHIDSGLNPLEKGFWELRLSFGPFIWRHPQRELDKEWARDGSWAIGQINVSK